jgi:hypothetical protein
MDNIQPIPSDPIGETHSWREWALKITAYVKKQAQGDSKGVLLNVPIYTTALAPAATVGAMYFDSTTVKFRVCEVAGTWKTVTTS